MKTEERATWAHIDSIIRNLEIDTLQARTTATGVATAPSLADATVDGMWFFLGVQVDTIGLRSQPVRLLAISGDDEPIHVLVADEGRRILVASKTGPTEIIDGLRRMQINVDWTEGAGNGF